MPVSGLHRHLLRLALAATLDASACGDLLEFPVRDGVRVRAAHVAPTTTPTSAPVTLLFLPGGGGHVDLDGNACPRALKGNSLVRTMPLFTDAGFHVVLVDAPSDHAGPDGLGGFRTDPRHAGDLGRIVAAMRARLGGTVWVVGTSRGTISAANLAARERGPSAPDGVVLTSVLTSGQAGTRLPWVAQSVFDLPLAGIRVPMLVVGHAADTCVRTPVSRQRDVLERSNAPRRQAVTVTGGPGGAGLDGVAACEGRSPHGFLGQEAELVSGIARFVRGGEY